LNKYVDPLKNIDNYSNMMSISKVVMFFEKEGITLTKTTIQNYIKINLLPKPVNKRYYNKSHFITIVIISLLKPVYSLEQIKKFFLIVTLTFNKELCIEKEYYDFYTYFIQIYETKLFEIETYIQKNERYKAINDICFLMIDTVVKKEKVESVLNTVQLEIEV
jgi:DNA-binding transcriptional MerR regulator